MKKKEQISKAKMLTDDPTPYLARKFRSALSKLKKQNKFTKREYEYLYPSDPIPPRMYGTIKAHKPENNYPMRVVVSTIGTPSYRTSEHLVKIIQPTLNKNKTRLKNSKTFVETSKSWTITPDKVQVSYDLSISTGERSNRLLLIWEDKIYLLQNSGPIGLALMVVVAEAFLQYHERNAISVALQRNPPVAPKSFKRYVDDSHARFKNLEEAKSFQNIMNEQNDNIKYTMEI
ncbi:uncharacterized protein LOC130657913 [Hydractinia symbiolongicarpus]|uniref:uncharacterized protein LOC130657913 n=1 Tax=Hydractinia symbiolongicarpus TaxID=13093 RepID=UPI00254A429B|nr:uncharacterized protein LOC130657913 [Hydractinia symbiolongicarpus]